MFDEPEAFKPERYLQSQFGTRTGADTSDFRDNFLFGAGRVGIVSVLPSTIFH